MLGIFFADGDQFFDHHTWQLHESPYATSDLEFKGALKDSARSVYSGLIKVCRGRAEDRRLPAEPQPGAEPPGARRLDPEPGDRRQRCALHPRRDRLAGRGGAHLLPAGARHPAHRGAEADRRRLLPPGHRPHPGRGDPGIPGEARSRGRWGCRPVASRGPDASTPSPSPCAQGELGARSRRRSSNGHTQSSTQCRRLGADSGPISRS